MSEIKEANLKKLHSKMTYSSQDIYQLIDDSSSFQVVKTFYDKKGALQLSNWYSDYILAQSDYMKITDYVYLHCKI